MPQCHKCGSELAGNAKFCPECGAPFGSGPEAPPVPDTVEGKTLKRGQEPTYGILNLEHLPPGHIIDARYEIKEKLGRGGFGVVYRAFDRNMNIDKALKIIPEAMAGDEEAMADLQREARTMIALEHPNIVRVYDFHYAGKIKYIDMAYIDGRTLTKIKMEYPDKRVPEDKVKELSLQIAEGLAYAHSRGIIHKDIKPQNIMVNSEGRVKIMDFGIAETVRSSMSRVAQTSSTGTLEYMSPEQLGGKDVGKEADIYSFGAVLYELLSGHPPFYKGDIRNQILSEKPAIIENVSLELLALIMWCLEKEFQKRCGIADVQTALGGKPTSSRQAGKRKPSIMKVIQRAGGRIDKLSNISINTEPAGATVWIDGKRQKKVTPITVDCRIGNAQVRIEKEGYASVEERIQITEQEVNRFRIELESITGSIAVKSDTEGHKIWLNGNDTGLVTPHTFNDLLPGGYMIELRGKTYYSQLKKQNLGPKETQTIVLETVKYTYVKIQTQYDNLDFLLAGTRMHPGEKRKLKPGQYSLQPLLAFLPTIELDLKPGQRNEILFDDFVHKRTLTIETHGQKASLALSCKEIPKFHKSIEPVSGQPSVKLSLLPGNYMLSLKTSRSTFLRNHKVELTSEDVHINVGEELERRQKKIQRRATIFLGAALLIATGLASIFWYPPSPAVLISPTDSSIIRTSSFDLNWADVFAANRYKLIVDNNRNFGSPVVYEERLTRSYILLSSSAFGRGTYYWAVMASNRAGNWGDWSSIRSFTVRYNPVPVAPTLNRPSNSSTMTDNTPFFDWSDVAHAFKYQLKVGNNRDFSSLAVLQSHLRNSKYTRPSSSALGNRTYYWKVRARNRAGDWSPWSSVRSFRIRSRTDDAYEPNNSRSNAYDLSNLEDRWLNSIHGRGKQRDDDWYKISVSSGYRKVTIICKFIHRQGDIDIALHDRSGNELAKSRSTSDNERIVHLVPRSGTHYIRVFYKNAGNQYDLWWDDTK